MKKIILHIRNLSLLIILLLSVKCSLNVADTSGSETGNANVIGNIVNLDGSNAAKTEVIILPYNFNPIKDGVIPDSLIDTTDNNGHYSFSIRKSSIYTIQAVHTTQRTRMVLPGITISGDTTISTDTLKSPGKINVLLPDTVDTINGYLYIPGTDIFTYISSLIEKDVQTHSIVIDSIPVMKSLQLKYGKKGGTEDPVIVTNSFTTKPDSTLIIEGFVSWKEFLAENFGLPSNNVNVICVDNDGNIWIGTEDAGVAKFDGTAWTVYNTSNSLLPDNNVYSIAFDKNGNSWFGTYSKGVARLNNSVWEVYNTQNSDLPNDSILSIAIDSSRNIWFGTSGGGVAKFDGTVWTVYDFNNSGVPDWINCVQAEASGTIWVSTWGNGVCALYDTTWTHYVEASSGLPGNVVNFVYIDRSGDKWFGTNSGGLAKFDGTNWTVYDMSNSDIPSNHVVSIDEDSEGTFWIGMINGSVSKFDGTNWIVYDHTIYGQHYYGIKEAVVDTKDNKWCTRDVYPGGILVFGPQIP